jgi:hypothetical protein
LLFAEKLHALGLLPYGDDSMQQQFALGETLGDDSLELDPVGVHRIWLVPKMDPVVIISLLSKAAVPAHLHASFRAKHNITQNDSVRT